MSDAINYVLNEMQAGRFTVKDIVALVLDFQDTYNLKVDGMPGPTTVQRIRGLSWYKQQDAYTARATVSKLERAGQLALAEAQKLWALDVYDPAKTDVSDAALKSKAVITNILSACDWGGQPYKGDGQVEWCGLFAGACWRAAGLDPKWLKSYFPSTYRLDKWAAYETFGVGLDNPAPKDPTTWRRRALLDAHSQGVPWTPQPGDILMIGDGLPATGDHICLVESYDAATKTFKTYEGNGRGLGPDGKQRQGIVRGERKLGGGGYCARRLIRPAEGDLL